MALKKCCLIVNWWRIDRQTGEHLPAKRCGACERSLPASIREGLIAKWKRPAPIPQIDDYGPVHTEPEPEPPPTRNPTTSGTRALDAFGPRRPDGTPGWAPYRMN
jgi:hypothetical protein